MDVYLPGYPSVGGAPLTCTQQRRARRLAVLGDVAPGGESDCRDRMSTSETDARRSVEGPPRL